MLGPLIEVQPPRYAQNEFYGSRPEANKRGPLPQIRQQQTQIFDEPRVFRLRSHLILNAQQV